MDIAALSTVAAQANLSNQAGLLIMKKAMDTATQQNQDLLQILPTEGAKISPPHLGNQIDISA